MRNQVFRVQPWTFDCTLFEISGGRLKDFQNRHPERRGTKRNEVERFPELTGKPSCRSSGKARRDPATALRVAPQDNAFRFVSIR
jgi:hypothetical protein